MKKVILIAALGLFGLATSCTKDWVCECTSESSLGADDVVTETTITGVKKDAEDKCKKGNSAIGPITTTCVLTSSS